MILITGAAGYIGSHTLNNLYNNLNKKLIVVDNLSTGSIKNIPKGVTFIKGDIRDKAILRDVFSKHKISAVMHFAALISVEESFEKEDEYIDVNTNGTAYILEIMQEYNVKNFIFSSTAAVYGNSLSVPITESCTTLPQSPYGETKLEAEKLIENSGLNYIIFRYFNVGGCNNSLAYGNYKIKNSSLIPTISNSLLYNFTISIYGNDYVETHDGTSVRDFIHVDDIANAHILGLAKLEKTQVKKVINLGSNAGFSVKEIIDKTIAIYPNLKYDYKERRNGDVAVSICSNKKAKEILNWAPQFTLEDIIVSDYNWTKKTK